MSFRQLFRMYTLLIFGLGSSLFQNSLNKNKRYHKLNCLFRGSFLCCRCELFYLYFGHLILFGELEGGAPA